VFKSCIEESIISCSRLSEVHVYWCCSKIAEAEAAVSVNEKNRCTGVPHVVVKFCVPMAAMSV
jgi:hypothetical protein